MAEVKWIKVYTDIFDNRKIKQIESMPDGDAIIVIWFKLLCLAATVNDSGAIYLTPEVPYTEQMLSTQFSKPLSTVQLALHVFESFGMVEVIDNILAVSNWEKYQNVDGMERIREQNRIRQKAWYERQKQIPNVSNNVIITQPNATDKDIEIDKEKESITIPPAKEEKHKHGEFRHVLLTDTQLKNLVDKFGEVKTMKMIQILDEAIEMKGYKYKNHYLVITKADSWVQREAMAKNAPVNTKAASKNGIVRGTDLDSIVQNAAVKHTEKAEKAVELDAWLKSMR